MAFADLGLPGQLVTALSRFGITDAFPIQAATIADALEGRDVLGKARTGSGKTLAFGLPTLTRLADAEPPRRSRPLALVIVPTRELAMQVNDALEPYAHALGVSLRLVAGGLSMTKQVQALERGVHLVVATPGRLADLVRRGHADLRDVEITVLDEADHMAQMGFMEEITEILAKTPRDGQRLLFSATLDGDIEALIEKWMHSPVTHDVTESDAPAHVEHVGLNVPPHIKYQLATRIANRDGRTIAFVRTKLAADRIAEQMRNAGVLAVALHGDKPQAERTAAITGFRAGQIPVLVATDVAARGIHVDHVDLVLQIDPPIDPKDYTHRAGRTARAGATGLVVTMVLPHQRRSTDTMFEGAGIDPLFRKIKGDDAESLAMVDKLTGASEPSGVPVEAPAVKVDERDWRANRDAARLNDRMAHNGAGRRAPQGSRQAQGARQAPGGRPVRGGYDTAARQDRASNTRADDLSKREAELIARERALAEREGALTQRESAPRADTKRPPKGEGWAKSKTKAPYKGKPQRKSDAETRRHEPRSESAPQSSSGTRGNAGPQDGYEPRKKKAPYAGGAPKQASGKSQAPGKSKGGSAAKKSSSSKPSSNSASPKHSGPKKPRPR